ncbi:Hypothetical protein RG1141_CH01320 [Neorhizobium galegae bv. officinalis bv. officinalis str. HAMBI 1141]|uniref:Uncharacterized protein n=1 Tax=Neorhizobium galegae bv. officinalis bv. officinalis str. HAMBI 1141 TaxID=1028801 RepID=A0A068T218_NEOGA|nr:hypothetical protein [Neorhizobium galegae]CDN52497.1 Hypothetical protein RG1141_CH01320 [Neorhizobium galegae bv. officinalis bv. officinalis str. HAMBI 1141]
MSKVAFKQADMERIFKAAAKAGAVVQMDMKTLIATILPLDPEKLVDGEGNSLGNLPSGNFAPDGKENWDED